jgi:hypothetical protein
VCIAALGKEAVWIVSRGQPKSARVYAVLSESAAKRLRGFLAATVYIGIKGQVDGSRTVTQLSILAQIEMSSHRAGDVMETGLPQRA